MVKRSILLVHSDPNEIHHIRALFDHAKNSSASFSSNFQFQIAEFCQRLEPALIFLKDHPVDAVLVHLNLPDSQGIDTFCRLKDVAPHLPILVVGDDRPEGLFHQVMAEGAADCLMESRLTPEGLVWPLAVAIERQAGSLHSQHAALEVQDISFLECLPNKNSPEDAPQYAVEAMQRLVGQVFNSTDEGILVTDAQDQIVFVNPAFTQITGFTADEAVGLTPRILQSGQHEPAFYQNIFLSIAQTGRWQGEIWNRRKNGEVYPEWLTISQFKDEKGQVQNYVSIFSDITARKQDEQRLRYLASHDVLTKLPNRALFEDRLETAISRANRKASQVAVLFLDLDGFKEVNDSFGHLIGDYLLQVVAERLKRCVRKSDTVARLAGDEFTVLLEDVHNAKDALIVAQKIINSIFNPFMVQYHEIHISVSVGVSIYPRDGVDSQTLLQRADEAMYNAKKSGKNTLRFYKPKENTIKFLKEEV